jgi:hydroxysqualene dehydroxylase
MEKSLNGKENRPMSLSVAVIGAGYAGLACAVELAAAGVPVTLFERSHTLGGRARVVAKEGLRIDNGQHLFLGAYTETQRLLRRVGVSPKAFAVRPLDLHYPGLFRLQAARLPAPFHLLGGLLSAKGLSWKERLDILRPLRWLSGEGFKVPEGQSVAQFLDAHTRTPRMRALFWEALCLAALNTPPKRACAQVFANVLKDSLTGAASAADLWIPKVDLSDLFPVPAARYLATHRGQVRTANPIDRLIRNENGTWTLEGDPLGQRIYSHVVVACAPYHALPLLSELPGLETQVRALQAFEYEAIATVYLVSKPAVILPGPMIGLVNGPGQWAFSVEHPGLPEGLLAVVSSAVSVGDSPLGPALLEAVCAQLEATLGVRIKPSWHQVIIEKRATFACVPGLVRPANRMPLAGLWLAGDYTEGPYPATLEGAIRSGAYAAQGILGEQARPQWPVDGG